MSELKFTKGVDSEHEIELESSLISASWRTGLAIGGTNAKLEVRTCFVGNGATIKITAHSESGSRLGKIKDKIRNNIYLGEIPIPGDIEEGDRVYFEVDLPKNGVSGESTMIPATPPVVVSNMRWSAEEARRGDVLELTAEVEGIRSNTPVSLVIYEYDRDSAHDKIATIPAEVVGGRVEALWEYEYHEDTDEIPTEEEMQEYGRNYNPPEYFFTILYEGQEFGREQESGLLLFKDWVCLKLVDGQGNPIGEKDYQVTLPDGETRSGKLDRNGRARLDNIPPGRITVQYQDLYPEIEEVEIDNVEEDTVDEDPLGEGDYYDDSDDISSEET